MPATPSPPTARALDVIELLARNGQTSVTMSDVARDLGQTISTSKAILETMCERGWATRDPLDKTYTLGPALAQAAMHVASARPLATAAHDAAKALASATGFATTISERVGDHLVFTLYGNADDVAPVSGMGEEIPYAAPFGPAFAAWDSEEERRAWISRSTQSNTALARRINDMVNATRERGYSVERMSVPLMQATQVMSALQQEALAQPLGAVIEQLLVEITTLGYLPDSDHGARSAPVTALAAPVLDKSGRVRLNIGVHPFCPLTRKQIETLGRQLVRATTNVSAATAPAG